MPYVNPFLTSICCNAQTMNTIGRPPMEYEYVRSCCNTVAQAQADVATARVQADRAKALARFR